MPLGAWALADLDRLGGQVFVNASRHVAVLRDALSSFSERAEFFIEQPEPFGSAGTLAALRQRFPGPVVTRNADMLSDISAADVVRTHIKSGTLATIGTVAVPGGADLVVEGGRAVRLVNRKDDPHVPGHMWLGVAVFERPALDLIGPERPLDLALGLVAELIARDEVTVHEHPGYALDVGTFDRYLTANLDVLYGRAPQPPVKFPGSAIEVDGGRAYVGRGAEVDERSLGPGAVVMAGSVVAPTARIQRGVVGPNEQVPEGISVANGIWALGHFFRAAG